MNKVKVIKEVRFGERDRVKEVVEGMVEFFEDRGLVSEIVGDVVFGMIANNENLKEYYESSKGLIKRGVVSGFIKKILVDQLEVIEEMNELL
jgi:hypothetical protein